MCHPGSLIDLRLFDLLEKSNVNEQCLDEARRTFERNYNESFFLLIAPFNGAKNPQEIKETAKSVMIFHKNINVIKGIFNNFGNLLHRIMLSFERIKIDDGEQIIQSINGQCSDSLEVITIKGCQPNLLRQLNNTFKNVHTLTFSSSPPHPLEIGSVQMNMIFPNVKVLRLDLGKPSEWTNFNGTFPKLAELSVNLAKSGAKHASYVSHIVDFLKINKQIVDLALTHSSLSLLKEVNDILVNLKTLHLNVIGENYLNYEGDPIEFHSVRILDIVSEEDQETPEKIEFPKLNKLRLTLDHSITSKWIKFLVEQVNSKLKILEIITEDTIAMEQFLDIPERIPNMREITIDDSTSYLQAREIMSFLKACKQCTYVNFNIRMEQSDKDELKGILWKHWHMEVIEMCQEFVSIRLNR